MQTVIVTTSRSPHRNTLRLAQAIAAPLDARIVSPDEATTELLATADRIGLGSGTYYWKLDPSLFDVAARIPQGPSREAFVFATSGMPAPPFRRDLTKRLASALRGRGLQVLDSFVCRGRDTWGPFGLVGGTGRGRPDASDLAAAEAFATSLPG